LTLGEVPVGLGADGSTGAGVVGVTSVGAGEVGVSTGELCATKLFVDASAAKPNKILKPAAPIKQRNF
jgi:hypothetical protein